LLFRRFLRSGFSQGSRGTTTRQFALLLFLLPESEQFGVIVGVGFRFGDARAFQRFDAARSLKDEWRDQSLDLGRFSLRLFLAFFQFQRSPDDVLPNIVVFVQVKQFSDLAGSLRAKTTGNCGVGQTWNLGFSLLDDDEMKNGEIGVDDATSDTPAVTLSGATRTIAAVLSAEQKADSSVSQDALHHGKALFVVSTADSEDVTLPFVAEGIAGNFLRHLLVEKDAKFAVIFDLDEFLTSRGRVGDIQLHPFLYGLQTHLK